MTVLTPRALNRALLARQGLLAREAVAVPAMAERLVGLQAQEPWNPYVGLWSRLEGFDVQDLSGMVARGDAVRMHGMRATIHLFTLRDAQRIRPVLQPVVQRRFVSSWRRRLGGADVDAIAAAALPLVSQRPHTRQELSDALAERWPEADAEAVGYAAIAGGALLQVPPRGEWRGVLQPTWAPIPGPLTALTPEDLVRRYLRAFGPSTVADLRTWSGMSGLREVVERLRPELRTFRDDRGRELLDVPDGPLPGPDVPAPPRFLPVYDNVFLSHDDASRIVGVVHPLRDLPRGSFRGSVLVDGFVAGHWTFDGVSVALHGIEADDALTAEAEALRDLLSSPGRAP